MNSEQWDKRYQDKPLVWSKGPNRFLVEQLEAHRLGRALDLGCGEGRNALWLAQQGYEVTGTDFSPVAIAKAVARAEELDLKVCFQVTDATKPLTATYDLIIVFYLHLPPSEMKSALQAASNALASGGTLLFVAHDARNIEEGWGGPQEPSILLSPEQVSAMLPDLKIETANTIERPVEDGGTTHIALDVLVRASHA